MTEQKHTPGPLTITVCARLAGEPCLIDGPDGDPVAQTEDHGHSIPEQHANARLLAAAYTSYDRHCGPRAVECAEADLLGRALEACEAALKWIDGLHNCEFVNNPEKGACDYCEARGLLLAAIAEARGEEARHEQ